VNNPLDDPRPVTVPIGCLYALICGSAIASGTFDGSGDARKTVLMCLSVSIPEAKQAMRNAGWEGGW
jgi:hypothetical protein